MKLAGFNILDVIYSVDETVVARAEAADGNQLVLKYQNTSHPSLDLIARWHGTGRHAPSRRRCRRKTGSAFSCLAHSCQPSGSSLT